MANEIENIFVVINDKNPHTKSDIRNLKSEIKRVPIIAMTGNAAEASFDEQHYPGMNDCIGKPLQRDFLL